jgi:hypothetical protein
MMNNCGPEADPILRDTTLLDLEQADGRCLTGSFFKIIETAGIDAFSL